MGGGGGAKPLGAVGGGPAIPGGGAGGPSRACSSNMRTLKHFPETIHRSFPERTDMHSLVWSSMDSAASVLRRSLKSTIAARFHDGLWMWSTWGIMLSPAPPPLGGLMRCW